jgi:hypothetical protein
MIHEYYRLTTAYATYIAEVQHQYPGVHKVNIGNTKKCVSFSVYLEDDELPNLDALGYNESCNSQENLVRGIGTKHMLRTAMEFVLHKYPKVSHRFMLKDISVYPCSQYKVDLWAMYLTFHNKTWYEAKFEATPFDLPDYPQMKKDFKAYLNTKPNIKDLEALFSNKSLFAVFKQEYEENTSLISTLKTLNDKYTCDIFFRWLARLVTKIIPIHQGCEWIIAHPKGTIKDLKITQIQSKPEGLFIMHGGDNMILTMDD